MVKHTHYRPALIVAFLFCQTVLCMGQAQDSNEMQNQKNLANVSRSKSDVAEAKTPLKTYEQWYTCWKQSDIKGILKCLTPDGVKMWFSGEVPTSDQLDQMAAALKEIQENNFQEKLFIYTTDLNHPRIRVELSYQQGNVEFVEEYKFTFVDTANGWKIDAVENEEKGKKPIK